MPAPRRNTEPMSSSPTVESPRRPESTKEVGPAMLSTLTETTVRHALERAAEAARLAPSIHNTQPWAFHVTSEALEMRLDRSRGLCVADPDGREALISCGA